MKMHIYLSLLALAYTLLGVPSSLKFVCGSTFGGGYRNASCVDSEKHALLLLKESLVDDLNYLSSWTGDDCCAWHGIGCNERTGHVIQLDLRNGLLKGDKIYPSLLNLKYLTYLDLSYNSFSGIKIPQFFGSFKDLTYLNLSYSNFEGFVPHHLGNLSNLRYLDLSKNDYNNSLLVNDSMRWVSGLSKLKHLDLSDVNLSRTTDWFSSINMLPHSISVLRLFNCQLSQNIPYHLPFINLTSLISLDLGYNNFNSYFPLWVLNNSGLAHLYLGSHYFEGSIPDSIGTLTSLVELDLRANNFNGSIPESIGRLKSLSSLDVSSNQFQGPLPESMGSLISLTHLNLGYNRFEGLLPKWIGNLTALSELGLYENTWTGSIPESIGYLTSLTYLNFSGYNFQGLIPRSIGNLTSLYRLDFSYNELRGDLPEEVCQLSNLESLFVEENQLSGRIPECIGELSKLESLYLHSNSWEGFVTEHHFVNLTMLTDLSISSNSDLTLNISYDWVPPFQLENIYIESLKVGPKFPHWLLIQRQISSISMKNTSISDTIPTNWFASLLSQAYEVDLSSNDINVEQLSSLSSCPNGLTRLALSSNRFSGGFPSFLCNITSLEVLVISNNNFSGDLPRCLGNLTELKAFDVMNNSFSGDIPISLGSLVNLNYLNLHENNFVGEIPTQLCQYPSIQVLNLAGNRIIGSIPPCFGNFSAIITSNNDSKEYFGLSYGETIVDDIKGYELKYTSTLQFLFSIDLSNNNIGGEIPEELIDLRGLLNLNLAGNHLRGRIPERIGELKKLEVLDLSRNKLYGSIPESLSDLNFLSRLNLSFNNLSGRIPTGNQLQTLEDPSSIYAGNNQLCGQPISKPCTDDPDSRSAHDYNKADSDSDDERMWFYAGIGPGLLCGFLGFCASLHFIKSWRYFYFRFVELVYDKIVLDIALLRRKFQN